MTLIKFLVTLEKFDRLPNSHAPKFTGFFIIVERDPLDPSQEKLNPENYQLGEFDIPEEYESLVRRSTKCDHAVVHSSSFSKDKVMVSRQTRFEAN
jgi:hypothetical protein